MKRFISSLLLFACALECAVIKANALPPCLEILHFSDELTQYLRKVETTRETIIIPQPQFIEQRLAEFGMADANLKPVFELAMEVYPLFESRFIYEAIITETVIQGARTADDPKIFMKHYPLLSTLEKENFVEGVILNMRFLMMEEAIGPKTILTFNKQARRFDMQERDYASLKKIIYSVDQVGQKAMKLALFNIMRNPSPALLKYLSKGLTSYLNFGGSFDQSNVRGDRSASYSLVSDYSRDQLLAKAEQSETELARLELMKVAFGYRFLPSTPNRVADFKEKLTSILKKSEILQEVKKSIDGTLGNSNYVSIIDEGLRNLRLRVVYNYSDYEFGDLKLIADFAAYALTEAGRAQSMEDAQFLRLFRAILNAFSFDMPARGHRIYYRDLLAQVIHQMIDTAESRISMDAAFEVEVKKLIYDFLLNYVPKDDPTIHDYRLDNGKAYYRTHPIDGSLEWEAARLGTPFQLRPMHSPAELDQRIKELELRVQDLKHYL